MALNPEYYVLYKSLQIHHLEDDEIDHELVIRSIQKEPNEARSTKIRKLKNFLKNEKIAFEGVDRSKSSVSVDVEIKFIDGRIDLIRQYLQKATKYTGVIDALKSRLSHYFFRLFRLSLLPDLSQNDKQDVSSLTSVTKKLLNDYFSRFSPFPSVREKVLEDLNRSISELRVTEESAKSSESDDNSKEEEEKGPEVRSQSSEKEEESAKSDDDGTGKKKKKKKSKKKSDTSGKRNLLSTKQLELFDKYNPFAINSQFSNPQMNPYINPFFQSVPFYPMQFYNPPMFSGYDLPRTSSKQSRSPRKSKSQEKHKSRAGSKPKKVVLSDTESNSSSSATSKSSAGRKSKTKKHANNKVSKTICSWKLKYSGKDNGEKFSI